MTRTKSLFPHSPAKFYFPNVLQTTFWILQDLVPQLLTQPSSKPSSQNPDSGHRLLQMVLQITLWCLPSLLIIPSIWNDLHSPLHMHKHCPSFAIYLQKHFLHEMSLPLLSPIRFIPSPYNFAYGSSNVILYTVQLLSVYVFPLEILENRVYLWWNLVSQGLAWSPAHRMCSVPWAWMTVVSRIQWFYRLFLSLGKYYNSVTCFLHLWSLNTHFFPQIIFREVFSH